MENIIYNDNYFMDLDALIDYLIDSKGIENLQQLEDDFSIEVELTELETIFKIDAKELSNLLIDNNEERLHEDFDGSDENKILIAVSESVDFDKLRELLPKLYYGTGEFAIITKQDLIDYDM